MYAPAVAFTVGSNPTAVAVGDLNGDGKPDLVVCDSGVGISTSAGAIGVAVLLAQ